MKRKHLQVVFITFSLFFLSACNGLDELIDSATKFLESMTDDEEANNEGNDNENNTGNNVVNSPGNDESKGENEGNNNENGLEETNTGVALDSSLPFDERLLEQGYDILYMPNGFPYEVPYHWLYVQHQTDHKYEDGYLGTFCYDLPLQTQDVASYFDYMPDIQQTHYGETEDIIHRTSFTLDGFFSETTTSHLDFYLDEFGNTCADASVDYDYDGNLRETTSEIIYTIDESRSLPDGYADTLDYVRSGGELEALTVNYDDIISVRDKIYNRELEALHLVNGHPTIFPYEWYLVSKIDISDGFIGEFCTDRSMQEAIVNHQEMLGNMNANIEYLSIESSPKPNVASETGFAFNDMHGTGSWSGVSMFYANPDPDSDYPNHNCVRVEMYFSTDLVN